MLMLLLYISGAASFKDWVEGGPYIPAHPYQVFLSRLPPQVVQLFHVFDLG